MKIDTIVTNTLSEQESLQAKQVYVGSEEQALTYGERVPHYASTIAELIASMRPQTVLEFGCNAGRNLDQIRRRLPGARMLGVDINQKNVEQGKKLFDLNLEVADENWFARQSEDSFDVALTVSVIDHLPYPEAVLRQLLRISKHYLVLFELAHDRIGKATHNLYLTEDSATIKPAYRYSYIHDYRHECGRKFGACCLLDLHFPIGTDNLLDLYRLYVFSKREDVRTRALVHSITWSPIPSAGLAK
jgi:SAM-dependent methyltransferase